MRPRFVLFDIDDTVTRDGRVEPEAYAAMAALADAGIEPVAVTGRPLGWAEVFAWTWPVSLAIGENGAGWMWREGRALVTRYFDDEALRGARRAALDTLIRRMAEATQPLPLAGDAALRRCDAAWDLGETWRAPEAALRAARELISAAGMRALTSSVHLHAVPGGWDKAEGALRALRDRFGLEPAEACERTLFIGDSGNDAAAFERFPLSVGVANVALHLDALPTPPRYVTREARGRGFAELARHLLSLERSLGGARG